MFRNQIPKKLSPKNWSRARSWPIGFEMDLLDQATATGNKANLNQTKDIRDRDQAVRTVRICGK
ncbi:MAG TPA: hypothetical protein VHO70_02545 [Chitinispirillaceae bacterium]|nr:hypothetical protein [Chitinispirillaceae bacterium]